MSDAIRNLVWILRHGGPFGRTSMLWTYLRIVVKRAVLVRVLGRSLSRERIWDQTIAFPDYETFAGLFEEIYLPGMYTFRPLRSTPLIVDGGANIGVSVAYFTTLYPDARLMAFEADGPTFEVLSKNCARNGWRNVSLYQHAVHRTDGVLPFFGYEAGSLVSSFRREMSGSAPARITDLPTVRLSTFIEQPVDLLKLDIEGSELAVLEDLAESGKLALVEQIILEYHHHIVPSEDRLGALLALFESHGFGYELRAPARLPFAAGRPQNFMMYAYRKSGVLSEAVVPAMEVPVSVMTAALTAS
jgi:FkbM family methyltransferase